MRPLPLLLDFGLLGIHDVPSQSPRFVAAVPLQTCAGHCNSDHPSQHSVQRHGDTSTTDTGIRQAQTRECGQYRPLTHGIRPAQTRKCGQYRLSVHADTSSQTREYGQHRPSVHGGYVRHRHGSTASTGCQRTGIRPARRRNTVSTGSQCTGDTSSRDTRIRPAMAVTARGYRLHRQASGSPPPRGEIMKKSEIQSLDLRKCTLTTPTPTKKPGAA